MTTPNRKVLKNISVVVAKRLDLERDGQRCVYIIYVSLVCIIILYL